MKPPAACISSVKKKTARWRGLFIANWPWQALVESRFLLLFPFLPPRQQEFLLPLLPLLHLSFTSVDWHVQSNVLFVAGRGVSLCFTCFSVHLVYLFSQLFFPLPLPLSTPSPTTGWRYLLWSTDSCLHPFFVSLHVSLCFLSPHFPLPPLKGEDIY